MKKLILIVFMHASTICMLYSQNSLLLNFEAEESQGGSPVMLDSVYVKNLDKDCDTTVYGEAPSLLLYLISGLDIQSNNSSIAKVYPNPFYGSTRLNINLSESNKLSLTLYDLQGKPIFTSRVETVGDVLFVEVQTTQKISILKVEGKNINTSFTLINMAPGKENCIESDILESGKLKHVAKKYGFQYEVGDQLQMIGFADGYFPDSYYDSPSINTTYTFQLEQLPPPTPPEIQTLHITEILHTVVTGGGMVIHDGWSPVTARGLCWSVESQPTIDDNFSIEGTGIGLYISTMTGLDTNTTYYVRAYATNEIGTAYGEQMNFTSKSDIPCPGIPSVTHGGQVYETVLIGNQCWLKQNMNIGTMILSSLLPEDNGVIEKWCYDDDSANCDAYGGLYHWDEVMQYSITPGSQGICPEGWHVPTNEEIKKLEGTADSQYGVGHMIWDTLINRGYDVCPNLKSSEEWYSNGNGTDVYGFSGLPAGYRWPNGGFNNIGETFILWTSDEQEYPTHAWVREFRWYLNGTVVWDSSKIQGFSVRCVSDESFKKMQR